jgi:hypothetical protein
MKRVLIASIALAPLFVAAYMAHVGLQASAQAEDSAHDAAPHPDLENPQVIGRNKEPVRATSFPFPKNVF